MPYDLYGNHYSSYRDAENAEMAQMAQIESNIAYHKVQELEQKLINQQQSQDYELYQKVEFLMGKVQELGIRLRAIETNKTEG